MNLRDEFKEETGLRTIVDYGMGDSFYTEDYVEWLEDRVKKLSISDISNSAFVEMLQKQQNKVCSCCGDIDKAGWKECGCDQEGFNRGIEKAIEMFIKHYC